MSQFMRQRNIVYEVKAGSTDVLQFIIYDDTGLVVRDLSDTAVYATAKLKVWKPDGTLVIDGTANFADRVNGLIQYVLTSANTINTNAGKWEGEIEIKKVDATTISLQTDTFSFIIRNSY